MTPATAMPPARAALSARAAARRAAVLGALRAPRQALSTEALAERLGVHANTLRPHIAALVADGRIERELVRAPGRGRPRVVYRARRAMGGDGTSNYRLLAAMLTEQFARSVSEPAAAAQALGREHGIGLLAGYRASRAPTRTAVLSRITELLAELGFEPEAAGARAAQIRLRNCPFLDLVADHADVVCFLHLGLMQGAMSAMSSPITVSALTPFAEPDLCLAQLSPAPGR